MRQKIVKLFPFEEVYRSQLTFSDADKIRLDPRTQRVELKPQSYNPTTGDAVYPTDTDLTVTTWLTNPDTLVAWAGFSACPHDASQPTDTTVQFKLNDGTDDRYWDGGTWAVAGATDWNDEATVAANIATFPASSQQIKVIINLVTTDDSVTPYVEGLRLLMDCEIDYIRSILADAVIPSIRQSLRPTVALTLRAPGGDLVDLRDLETAYNILDVTAVWNHDSDPQHQITLLSAYDTATKTITLSSSVERGVRLWLALSVEPEVYLDWGSQDYLEVAKLPAVVLENFDLAGNTVHALAQVDDMDALEASVRRDPFRLSLEFDVVLVAESNRTLLAMLDGALNHASTNTSLHWPAVDEYLDMSSLTEGLFRPRPSLKDEHTVRYTLKLHNIHLWLRPEETIPLVQRVNLTLTSEQEKGGPGITGVKTEQPHPDDC